MQEKTEQPSRRKLQKARERGEVAKSAELSSALIVVGALLLIWGLSSLLNARLHEVFTALYDHLHELEWEEALKKGFKPMVLPLLAIMAGVWIIAVLAHVGQAGWVWSWKRGRKKGKSRFLLSLFKIVVIGAIGYFSLRHEAPSLTPSPLMERVFFLLLKAALALLLIGIADFIYQKWKYHNEMRMSRAEVKAEKRETEGDRETKSRMRKR